MSLRGECHAVLSTIHGALILRKVIYRVHDEFGAVEKALKGILTISAVLMNPVVVVLSWAALLDEFNMSETITGVRWWYCALAILLRSFVMPGSGSDEEFGDVRFIARHRRISDVHGKRRSIDFCDNVLQRLRPGRNGRYENGRLRPSM